MDGRAGEGKRKKKKIETKKTSVQVESKVEGGREEKWGGGEMGEREGGVGDEGGNDSTLGNTKRGKELKKKKKDTFTREEEQRGKEEVR